MYAIYSLVLSVSKGACVVNKLPIMSSSKIYVWLFKLLTII